MEHIVAVMGVAVAAITEHAKRIFHLEGNKTIIAALVAGLLVGLVWKPLAGWFPIPDGAYSLPQYIGMGLWAGAAAAGLVGLGLKVIKKIKG